MRARWASSARRRPAVSLMPRQSPAAYPTRAAARVGDGTALRRVIDPLVSSATNSLKSTAPLPVESASAKSSCALSMAAMPHLRRRSPPLDAGTGASIGAVAWELQRLLLPPPLPRRGSSDLGDRPPACPPTRPPACSRQSVSPLHDRAPRRSLRSVDVAARPGNLPSAPTAE